MSWFNTINELAERYGAHAPQSSENTHEDFKRVAQSALQDVVSNGIAHMFRSDETPALPDMVSSLFGQSNQTQRAGLLSQILSSVGQGRSVVCRGLAAQGVIRKCWRTNCRLRRSNGFRPTRRTTIRQLSTA